MPVHIITDLRTTFGPARDQGDRPTCTAFALSDVHAVVRGSFDPLSVEYLFYHGIQRKPGRDPDSGLSLPTASAALEHNGQPLEKSWPYLPVLPADRNLWKPPGNPSTIWRRKALRQRGRVDDICTRLDVNQPVVLIIKISERFYAPDREGMVVNNPPDPDVGYHAVAAVGYGTADGERLILIRNSWGNSWGLNGYAWLVEAYLEPRLSDVATMA